MKTFDKNTAAGGSGWPGGDGGSTAGWPDGDGAGAFLSGRGPDLAPSDSGPRSDGDGGDNEAAEGDGP